MAHILIVEDDANIARLLSVRLERIGHSVTTVADGREAFATACRQNPALIMLDVMLPHMDGFQVAKQLKRDPRTRAIPIVMLTSRTDGNSVIAGLDTGVDMYLSKPIDFPDVVRRIEALLARNAGT